MPHRCHLAFGKDLGLSDNSIGDEGMMAFASAIASGALANLANLDLDFNEIGDDGIKAFSTAIASGALPAVENVYLDGNPGSDKPVKSALARRNRVRVEETIFA